MMCGLQVPGKALLIPSNWVNFYFSATEQISLLLQKKRRYGLTVYSLCC